MVYGFIEGKVFSVADLSDPFKSSLVAKNLAIWHGTDIAGEKKPNLFITLKKWLKEGNYFLNILSIQIYYRYINYLFVFYSNKVL